LIYDQLLVHKSAEIPCEFSIKVELVDKLLGNLEPLSQTHLALFAYKFVQTGSFIFAFHILVFKLFPASIFEMAAEHFRQV